MAEQQRGSCSWETYLRLNSFEEPVFTHPIDYADDAHGRILGELALEAGDATEATRLLEMARKAFTDMHALSGIAGSRLALGRVALLGGRAPEARIHFEAARVLYEEMADEGRIQTAWRGLAAAARSGGDVAAERRWLGELALSGSPGARWALAILSTTSRPSTTCTNTV